MTRDQAETIAIKALGWLAGQDDLLGVFLGSTGAAVDDVRARAAQPEFQVAVLEFLMMDDAWLTGFCDAEGLDYDVPQRAKAALPGGQELHWT